MIHHSLQGRRGFSLLELSIVLAIIALIAGVGIKMAGGALTAADRITTQERLNTIKLALDSFAKTYGYLPCPASRTLTPTNASFGVEVRNTTTHTNCDAAAPPGVVSNAGWYGAVPVRTLGLPDNYAGDAWGNKFEYAASSNLKADQTNMASNAAQLQVNYGDRTNNYTNSMVRSTLPFTAVANNGGVARVTVTGSPPANGTLVYISGGVYKGSYIVANATGTTIDLTGSTYSATDSGTVTWQVVGKNTAYVVLSHGKDGRGAFPLNGTSIPANKKCNNSAGANSSPPPCTSSATTTCIDIENCNDDPIFFDTAYNDGMIAAQHFDDYIVWGSNDLQRTPLNPKLYTACPTGTGTCENWCATCTVNYPGGGATVPPASLTNPFLYKKIITSNSTLCNATCFWGGTTTGLTYTKGP